MKPDRPTDRHIELPRWASTPASARRPAETAVFAHFDAAATERPLAGLKVLDFMWAVAGPTVSRLLADAGATVIRVESSVRLDAVRTFLPFINNEPGPENGATFNNMNAGKLGITLNPGTAAGREVAEDLVRWADVVCESYTPRIMASWGLDYESVREINPSVVMLSSCLFGQTGPLADYAGYGNLSGALAGFYNITGWSDRAPVGPYGAITDYTSPHPATASLLAAIDHQRRTGEGRYLDFSQAEASIHFIAPAVLEYLRNGNVVGGQGNASNHFFPMGCPRSGATAGSRSSHPDDAAWQSLQGSSSSELADLPLAEVWPAGPNRSCRAPGPAASTNQRQNDSAKQPASPRTGCRTAPSWRSTPSSSTAAIGWRSRTRRTARRPSKRPGSPFHAAVSGPKLPDRLSANTSTRCSPISRLRRDRIAELAAARRATSASGADGLPPEC